MNSREFEKYSVPNTTLTSGITMRTTFMRLAATRGPPPPNRNSASVRKKKSNPYPSTHQLRRRLLRL